MDYVINHQPNDYVYGIQKSNGVILTGCYGVRSRYTVNLPTPTNLSEQTMSQPVCAIIGAGEGLGQALAAKFASQGFDIALISRSEAGSAAATEAATAVTANVRYFSADASQPDTIETALAKVADEMDEIDVLVYNARGKITACEPLHMTYAALEDNY